jgi:dephospho-CoA kinase
MTANRGQRPYIVALTGGIASGKSTVSDLFAELGVPVVDTDKIARELVEPGQPLLASIVGALGKELLDAYGRLQRRKLREMIFASSETRSTLERIMHPKIIQEAEDRILRLDSPYCLLVIPLLAESGDRSSVDRVLVVDSDTETRTRRLMTRDAMTREEVEAALSAQASREARLSIADDIIDNSGEMDGLPERVRALHQRYLELAHEWRHAPRPPDSLPIG